MTNIPAGAAAPKPFGLDPDVDDLWAREIAAKAQKGIDEDERADIEAAFARLPPLVLDYLQRFVMRVPGFEPQLGFENGAAYGFYRSGQIGLIAHVFALHYAGKDRRKKDKATE